MQLGQLDGIFLVSQMGQAVCKLVCCTWNVSDSKCIRESLIRLLSLFEYMLEDSGSAENKEILLFSHDKLSLASILRPLHQVTKESQGLRKSKASPGLSRKQCSYVYRTPPQSQHWQVPAATHLGPTSASIASIPT